VTKEADTEEVNAGEVKEESRADWPSEVGAVTVAATTRVRRVTSSSRRREPRYTEAPVLAMVMPVMLTRQVAQVEVEADTMEL
jgi:hypothetical protein